MPRFRYQPDGLHGPAFEGDDDSLLRQVQLDSRWYIIEHLYRRCREDWRRAERMLRRRTVLGELLAGEPGPPDGALLDVHDTLAAAFRRSRKGDRQLELPLDGLTPAQRLRSDWFHWAREEWSYLAAEHPDLVRLVLTAALHHGSGLGGQAEDDAVAILMGRLGFAEGFPDRVTEFA